MDETKQAEARQAEARQTESGETFPPVTPDMVPPHGLRVPLGAWARRAAGEGADGDAERLGGALKIRRFGAHLLAQGRLSGAFAVRCELCRERLSVELEAALSCLYSPISTIPGRTEDEEGDFPVPEEVAGKIGEPVEDQGEYDGVALDLQDVVREVFALERPPVYRCDELAPGRSQACDAAWRAALGAGAGAGGDEVGAPLAGNAFAALAGFKPTR